MKTTLSMLIHGTSGVGKSWLADTAPAPRVVFDAEGRAKYTPSGPKIGWDPRASAPPAYDGTWETCVVNVADFETFHLGYQWLRAGEHPFVSAIIDSVMEAQKRCIDTVVGVSALEQQDWGTLLRKMEALVRSYRDLTLIESNPVQAVIMVCGTRSDSKTGQMEPLLQGQLADTIPYYVDVVGYYHKQPQPDGSYVRALLVDEIPGYIAKDGTDRLVRTYGPIIQQPNIGQLFELLKSNGQPAPVAPAAVVAQEGVAV